MSAFIDWARLAEPFPYEDVEFRLQQAGETNGRTWAICVPYVTARAIQERFDEVVGPGNWKNEYSPGPSGGVQCGISLRVGDEWVTKYDGAENTGKSDTEMAIKGGYSSAFKRAAVVWSVGRYLYRIPEMFAVVGEGGRERGKTRDGKPFRWNPPELPEWALPRKKMSEHEALLKWINENHRAASTETAAHVRQEWDRAKQDATAAATLAGMVEADTGITFTFSANCR